jgi:hypothetical protein
MQIILSIKNKNKTFFASPKKAIIVRKATALKEEINKDPESLESLDRLVEFVCEVYDNKFTPDELYNGLDSEILTNTLIETLLGAQSGVISKLASFPDDKQPGREDKSE